MRGRMENLLVLYWEARGFQKLSPFIPLPRLHPAAPCHIWWGSYHSLQDFTRAFGRGTCSVTGSEKYLLCQWVLPISLDCINASATTTPREILVTQILTESPTNSQWQLGGCRDGATEMPQPLFTINSTPGNRLISLILYRFNQEKKNLHPVPNNSSIWMEIVAFWKCELWRTGTKQSCASPACLARDPLFKTWFWDK